jgi:hypothetical protein
MTGIDDQVNAWLLDRFLWSGDYDKSKHGTINSIEVVSVDMGWDCLCWSEWTRDDSFGLTGKFTSSGGDFTWTYGRWGDLPQFIEELDEYAENGTCRYADDEEYG